LNTKLDVIANNLANVNTQGFKRSRVNFEDLLYQEKKLPGVENGLGDATPTGLYVGLGTKVSGTQLEFEQGAFIETEKDLDLAVDGEGFFRVEVVDGVSEEGVAYTRAGNFTVNADGEVVLANDRGWRLSPGITVPEGTVGIEVSPEGVVSAQVGDATELQEIGTIQLAAFLNPQGLKQAGGNLFVESEASGPPLVGDPETEGLGSVQQGFLEASNVNPTRELVELIQTQRAFEINSQVIRAADETLRTIGQLRR
jgi:flagellar basal-body rod protein FlgG